MHIWHQTPNLESVNRSLLNTLGGHLDIKITDAGDDSLTGTMPVDSRTIQPHSILHGGASVALAETLGSIAGNLCLDNQKQYAVGLEINANHIRSIKGGIVTAVARPHHIGGMTQVWEIKISSPENKLICCSRITLAILDKR